MNNPQTASNELRTKTGNQVPNEGTASMRKDSKSNCQEGDNGGFESRQGHHPNPPILFGVGESEAEKDAKQNATRTSSRTNPGIATEQGASGSAVKQERRKGSAEECLTVEMPVVATEAPPVGSFVDVLDRGGVWHLSLRVYVEDDTVLVTLPRADVWSGKPAVRLLHTPGQPEGLPWQYSKCGECGARVPFCVDCEVDKTESATASEFDIPCIEGFADLLSRLPADARGVTIALGFELQDRIAAWWDRMAPATSQDVERWKLAQTCFKGAYSPTQFGPLAAASVANLQAKGDQRFAELWGAFMIFVNQLPAAVSAAKRGN